MSSHQPPSPRILFEDDALIVMEKPAGIPSCPPQRRRTPLGGTLEEWLQKKYPEAKLVHRLDNDTSGLLAAAKTEATFEKLRAVWKTPAVVKTYTALVLGRTPSSGTIDTPIAHHPRKKKKMALGGKKAREARTEYKTIRRFKNFSLVEIQITTGVRHQIRIHMASIGHPLAGDRLYQRAKKRLDTTGLKRHFLHLSRLELPHPVTGEKRKFESKLPDELENVIQALP